jgi:signal transduction histidine kinase
MTATCLPTEGRDRTFRQQLRVDMADARYGWKRSLSLRDKLFMSFSLLSVLILIAAAWVITAYVAAQTRQEVQDEIKASVPLYNAVWEEQAGRLSTLGMAMAGSSIVKTILGDPRASRDKGTVRQMLAEFGQQLSENVDLILISDGGGNVTFADSRDPVLMGLSKLPCARAVAESQKPAQAFLILGGKLYHLMLTPVLSHSQNKNFDNTLAVMVAGSELNRSMASELQRRAHNDILFFAGEELYASSLQPEIESAAAKTAALRTVTHLPLDQPVELQIAGDTRLAFVRMLTGFDGEAVGYVVVIHSLSGARKLLHAVSTRLVIVGTISIILVLCISYFIARHITRPIESLAAGAMELGRGNYEHKIDLSPKGEVGQLATAFYQMRQSIKQSQAVLLKSERLATVGQMASGIIHDLRSPLAAISNAAELIAGTQLSSSQRQALAQTQLSASQRMGDMLGEILKYSRGDYRLSFSRQALASLLDSAIQECVSLKRAPMVKVDVQIPPDIFVRVDRERARRIFENLLENSVQAMPQGGTITIKAEVAADKLRINIADTGSGIPAELRKRLFEPFVSQGKKSGTGLGLAIARSIAEAHGGSLTLVSAEGQPAEFCLELPPVSRE